MKLRIESEQRTVHVLLFLFLVSLAFLVSTGKSACAQDSEDAAAMEQPPQELATQYQIRVEEHQAEVQSLDEDAGRIEEAIGALRQELATENRRGRARDLRARIRELSERKEALDERIEGAREAVSGATDADESFHAISANELLRQQEDQESEIKALDERIAALETELEGQTGMRVRARNLRQQIEDLSRRRDELAGSPVIRAEDMDKPSAIQEELARSFREAEAGRRDELESVRTRIAELEKTLAEENRRVRRESIQTQIAELRLKEHELDIEPPEVRYKRDEAVDEPLPVVERGLKARQAEKERRTEVLDRQVDELRQRLRTEDRTARRESIRLQIMELERQRNAVGKPKPEVEPAPTKGFVGAPYGSPSDLDYEYTLPARNK